MKCEQANASEVGDIADRETPQRTARVKHLWDAVLQTPANRLVLANTILCVRLWESGSPAGKTA
jgi:hypothetical protein